MMKENTEKTEQKAGIWATVAAGFELVSTHWWLLVLPFLLDLFYWLGPRLSLGPLLADLVGAMQAGLGPEAPTESVAMLQSMSEQILTLAPQTNLFTVLSLPFLGVPGLMAGLVAPAATPLSPAVFGLENIFLVAGLLLLLSAAGLLLAAVYYGLIARVLHGDNAGTAGIFVNRRLPVYVIRLFVLAGALLLVAVALYIPLLIVATIFALFSPGLGSLLVMFGMVMIFWLFFYLSFSVQGIVLAGRPVFWSLLASVRLVQRYLVPALTLFLLTFGLRTLLTWLWLGVDQGNWFTLASIAGHTFVSTGFVAATFIFYRDRVLRDPEFGLRERSVA